MNEEDRPTPRTLQVKPLIEAIFELRWRLRNPGNGLPPHDPGFRIALGRFFDRVQQEYPVAVDLPTAQIPEEMTAYTVRHQFRAAKDKWPLTQLGPGILTVNETTGYTWSTFRPRLLCAIDAMFEAYPSNIAPFEPLGVQLRYLDAFPYAPREQSLLDFLARDLHTSITVDPLLFDDGAGANCPKNINLNMTFPLSKPRGTGTLGFATGLRDNEPVIVMETIIASDSDHVPQRKGEFETWLSEAHELAVDKWFFTLIRGRLLDSFEPRDAHNNR